MAQIHCTISFDGAAQSATVQWSEVPNDIKVGDAIKFTSNASASAIDFKHSPFDPAGGAQTLQIGEGKTLKIVKPLTAAMAHFDCGAWNDTAPGQGFVKWGGAGGDIPKRGW